MGGKKVLVYHPQQADVYKSLLEKTLPDADLLICHNEEELENVVSEAEIAFVSHTFPQSFFGKARNLRWVQAMAAGVESFVGDAGRLKNVVLTRMVGVDAPYMAEYVLAYMLYLSQKIDRVAKAQKERRWDPFVTEFICKKTCGIMGLGAIGQVIAKRAKGMGMRVISWDVVSRKLPFVDTEYEPEKMEDFLQESDYVVLILPAIPGTLNLIGRDAFKAMKKQAYLINICRGALVDEVALVEALKQGQIAGAVLDVVKQEPLPPNSELWDCPNLIVSPHISGPGLPEDMAEFFKMNFLKYLRGEPLQGVVDPARGY